MITIPILIWGAELALPPLSAVFMPMIYGAVTGAAAYGCYQGVQWLNAHHALNQVLDPPYEFLPEDSSIPPAKGFEWKGKGKPGSKDGAWFNPETKESLHADLENLAHAPHWDYSNKNPKERGRIYFDNTYEPK
jgi:hypothetical protein